MFFFKGTEKLLKVLSSRQQPAQTKDLGLFALFQGPSEH